MEAGFTPNFSSTPRSSVIFIERLSFFFSSRRRHTRLTCDWSSDGVLFRSLLAQRLVLAGPPDALFAPEEGPSLWRCLMPASAMGCHAGLLAHGEHRTGGAAGESAGADVLAERDEEAVDLDPIAPRQRRLERAHRFFRCPCLDVAPAVGDAVDVDINGDPRLAAGDAEHQMGALGADAVEREQN